MTARSRREPTSAVGRRRQRSGRRRLIAPTLAGCFRGMSPFTDLGSCLLRLESIRTSARSVHSHHPASKAHKRR